MNLDKLVEMCFFIGLLSLLLFVVGALLSSETLALLFFCLFIFATAVEVVLMIFITATN